MSKLSPMSKLLLPGIAMGYCAGKCIQMLPLAWQAFVCSALVVFFVSFAVTWWRSYRDLYLRFLNLQAELRMRYREDFERFERDERRR